MEARYPFVAVDVPGDRADEIGSLLFDLGAGGIEERDDGTLARGPGEGRVTLVGAFETRAAADAAIAALREAEPELGARLEEVVGDAWRDAWKEHFQPFALTPAITVVPPWLTYEKQRPDEKVLELEPGRAFGTGLHATTGLVAELLHEQASAYAGGDVLDVGTGSGILSLVALLYGAASATAIDTDPDVIEVVNENAVRNGLGERITARQGTVGSMGRTFPLVVANIEARVLGRIAASLSAAVAPGGTLILSGILASEEDAMVERYTSLSRKLEHEATTKRVDGDTGWVAMVFSAAS